MEGERESRYIENPFEKIFSIVDPVPHKCYQLLLNLIGEWRRGVVLPTLSCPVSDGSRQEDTDSYTGACGYLMTLLRLASFFAQRHEQISEVTRSSIHESGGDMAVMAAQDPDQYLQLALQQYRLLEARVAASKKTKYLSFYMSEVSLWHCGMILAAQLKDLELFRVNEQRIRDAYARTMTGLEGAMFELLYGVPGLLFALLELQRLFEDKPAPFSVQFAPLTVELTRVVVAKGLKNYGKEVTFDAAPPEDFRLVYTFHRKEYLGAAHGLSGNLNVLLLSLQLNRFGAEELRRMQISIEASVRFLLRHKANNGNFVTSVGSAKGHLVHFCHGAPGVVFCLAKFCEVFPEKAMAMRLSEEVAAALEHIWKFGVLKKGFGLCHGISGNAYAFIAPSVLRLFPERAEEFRKKALFFALLREEAKVMTEIRNFDFSDRHVRGSCD